MNNADSGLIRPVLRIPQRTGVNRTRAPENCVEWSATSIATLSSTTDAKDNLPCPVAYNVTIVRSLEPGEQITSASGE
jgi:hypothetical protein